MFKFRDGTNEAGGGERKKRAETSEVVAGMTGKLAVFGCNRVGDSHGWLS